MDFTMEILDEKWLHPSPCRICSNGNAERPLAFLGQLLHFPDHRSRLAVLQESIMNCFVIISAVIAMTPWQNSLAAIKTGHNISLLTFIMQTGQAPSTGLACSTAMRIVVDEANNRTEILPGYILDMQVRDEQRFSYGAAEGFMKFMDEPRNLAPIVVGPSTNCQYVSPLIRQYQMTEVTHGCTADMFVSNRHFYSNLYRTAMPTDSLVVAILKFVQDIGHWKQIGVATSAATANEYLIAKNLVERANENGLQVVAFSGDRDVSFDFVNSFKESDARVIALMMTTGAMCAKFLCQAHKIGMRSPNYVFIIPYLCYFVPERVADCSQQVIHEQLKVTFWIGMTKLFGGTYKGVSSFGYDAAEFERRLNQSFGNRSQQVPDYLSRLICHDSMMAAMVTLIKSEQLLQSKYNLTLSDFQFAETKGVIETVVNESAAHLDFVGLRMGRIFNSPRLEVDNENLSISQYVDKKMLDLYYVHMKVEIAPGSVYNLSRYGLEKFGNEPIWFTSTGDPPKDLSLILHLQTTLTPKVVWSLTGFGISIGSLQFGLLITSFGVWGQKTGFSTALPFHFDLRGVSLATLACLLLDLSVIVQMQSLCSASFVLPILAVTMLTAVLCGRSFTLRRLLVWGEEQWKHRHGISLSNATPKGSPSPRPLHSSSRMSSRGANRFHISRSFQNLSMLSPDQVFLVTLSFFLFLTVLTLVLIGIWVGTTDRIDLITTKSPVLFSSQLDVYYDVESSTCTAPRLLHWLAGFVAFNIALLIIASFSAYEVRTVRKTPNFSLDCKLVQLATYNAASVFVGILLVIVVMPESYVIILASGELLYSLSASAIFYYPLLSRKC